MLLIPAPPLDNSIDLAICCAASGQAWLVDGGCSWSPPPLRDSRRLRMQQVAVASATDPIAMLGARIARQSGQPGDVAGVVASARHAARTIADPRRCFAPARCLERLLVVGSPGGRVACTRTGSMWSLALGESVSRIQPCPKIVSKPLVPNAFQGRHQTPFSKQTCHDTLMGQSPSWGNLRGACASLWWTCICFRAAASLIDAGRFSSLLPHKLVLICWFPFPGAISCVSVK